MNQQGNQGQQGSAGNGAGVPAPPIETAKIALDYARPTTPLDYARPTTPLITLCRMNVMEAQIARAKLESEGIRCFVFDQEVVTANPLIFQDVKLQVCQDDADAARAILARPADDTLEGEYAEEEWRCPQCHRKTVELIPLPARWRCVRLGCLGILGLPLLLALLGRLVPPLDVSSEIVSRAVLPWALTLGVLTLCLAFVRREKRCAECGHRWGKQKEDEAD